MFLDYNSSNSDVNNVLCYSCHLVTSLLNFPENLLSVEHIGDEDPTGSSHEVLGQVLSVGLVVGHAPTEGEVLLKHFMAHVHKDGVHTWNHASERRAKVTMITEKFRIILQWIYMVHFTSLFTLKCRSPVQWFCGLSSLTSNDVQIHLHKNLTSTFKFSLKLYSLGQTALVEIFLKAQIFTFLKLSIIPIFCVWAHQGSRKVLQTTTSSHPLCSKWTLAAQRQNRPVLSHRTETYKSQTETGLLKI